MSELKEIKELKTRVKNLEKLLSALGVPPLYIALPKLYFIQKETKNEHGKSKKSKSN